MTSMIDQVLGELPKYLFAEDHYERLYPEGIGRVSRWEDEQPGSQPEWAAVCGKLKEFMDPLEARKWLAGLAEDVNKLPETMRTCQVDDDIIQRLAGWIDEVAAGLAEARPKTHI